LPVAVNCWVVPEGIVGILGLAGVTDIEERVAEVTVKVVLPKVLPEEAEMIVAPAARAVARPLPLMVATDVFEEPQETWVVISWFVPSE
jgi:hypothetical protein